MGADITCNQSHQDIDQRGVTQTTQGACLRPSRTFRTSVAVQQRQKAETIHLAADEHVHILLVQIVTSVMTMIYVMKIPIRDQRHFSEMLDDKSAIEIHGTCKNLFDEGPHAHFGGIASVRARKLFIRYPQPIVGSKGPCVREISQS